MATWHYILALLDRFSFKIVGSHILQALGILWLTVEAVSYFHPEFIPFVRDKWWVFLIIGTLIGLYRGWPRLAVRSTITGTDAIIEIRVGDLFDQDGAFVVAAPTTFDTSIEDNTIDPRSVQGQYTTRFCDSLETLNNQIETALNGIDFIDLNELQKPYGPRRRYSVGTVAPVMFNSKRAYFVAIATLNRHRNASATRNDLLDALPQLWENIRTCGGMDPINIPILGAGFSRVNATREELIREIIKSFVPAAKEGRFCERLTIIVTPSDYREGGLSLDLLARFLEHECMYGTLRDSAEPNTVGTEA